MKKDKYGQEKETTGEKTQAEQKEIKKENPQTEQQIQKFFNALGKIQHKIFEEQKKQEKENIKFQFKQAAEILKMSYDSYIEAGFDEEQALRIIIAIQTSGIQRPPNNDESYSD